MPPSKRKEVIARYRRAAGVPDSPEHAPKVDPAKVVANMTHHIEHSASSDTLRKPKSVKDLRDMFSSMSISRPSVTVQTELSTVKENVSSEKDEHAQYATLTEDNVQQYDEDEANQLEARKNMFLNQYAESDDDFEDFEGAVTANNFDIKVQEALQPEISFELPSSSPKKGAGTKKKKDAMKDTQKSPFFPGPVSRDTVRRRAGTVTSDQQLRPESTHSFSSNSSTPRSPTSASTTSFTETETDQSDYADDFENADFTKVNLMDKFKLRQQQAEKEANDSAAERKRQWDKTRESVRSRRSQLFSAPESDFIEQSENTIMEDFEDFEEIDPAMLRRFKVVKPLDSPFDRLDRKMSLPALPRSASFAKARQSPPKKTVRKYSSTLDFPARRKPGPRAAPQRLPVSLSLKARPYYTGNELDDIADLSAENLTITLSDYNKLKRKSQKIDLSQYAEEPGRHHTFTKRTRQHKHTSSSPLRRTAGAPTETAAAALTNTARLNKEGKLKMIRSMGSHKSKQVVPGHLYGDLVYDPDQMKWCGNEEELARFESASKPALITHRKSRLKPQNIRPGTMDNFGQEPQIVGNMIYDNKNLRWVSLTGKYEDDPFENLDDTASSEMHRSLPLSQRRPQATSTRIPSRLSSSASSASLSLSNYARQAEDGNYFQISQETYKAWRSEENRWKRKVGNWFPSEEDNMEFCYELKSFLNDQ